jgi:hypothetical protein
MDIKNRRGFNKKLFTISCIFLILISFLQTIIVLGDPGDTSVFVNPSNQIVSLQESFSISINCNPAQPIKSYEFKLSFDETLIEADSVTEGDIFNGYSTYFNSGIINNSDGTIINVYGLILGSGNVSSPGSFAIINFTSKSTSGISFLDFYEVGVTNETVYVPIDITNGSVQIDGEGPEFSDNSPSQGYTGDTYTFSVDVTDNVDSASNLSVYVDWLHGSNSGNDSMINTGGDTFEKSITLDLYSISDLTYNFYAEDSFGNSNTTSLSTITVIDNDSPGVNGIAASPSTQEIGGFVNISGEVTDNIGVDEVFLNITYPDSSYENISITSNVSNDIYYCNKTYNQYGTHYYNLWATDQANNFVTSSTDTFFIGDFSAPVISNIDITTSNPLDTDPSYGWINISCQAVDNVAVTQVYLNITNPDGTWNNLSMISAGSNYYYLNSSTAFSDVENYSYYIWAIDNDLNNQSSTSFLFSMPPNWDVNKDGVQNVLDLVSVSNYYGSTGNSGWIREDVDNNGKIQVLDFVNISNHYGESWWV